MSNIVMRNQPQGLLALNPTNKLADKFWLPSGNQMYSVHDGKVRLRATGTAAISPSPNGLALKGNNLTYFSIPSITFTAPYSISVLTSAPANAFSGIGSMVIGDTSDVKNFFWVNSSSAPYALAITPDGKFCYTGNINVSTASQYALDSGTGLMTPLNPSNIVGAGANPKPWGVTISPDGLFAYFAGYNSNKVLQYSINTTTGQLTPLGTPTINCGTTPKFLLVSPDGKWLYTANSAGNNISQFSRNVTTGQLTALGTPTIACGTTPREIAITPDSAYLYVTNTGGNTVSMYSINSGTGQLTALGTPTVATGSQPYGIVVSPNGNFAYVTNFAGNTVSMYSITTGVLAALGTPTIATGASTSPSNLVQTPDGLALYTANDNNATVSQFSCDTSTGLLTALSPATVSTGGGPYGIKVSPNGNFLYVLNNDINSISQFSITSVTKLLVALSPATFLNDSGVKWRLNNQDTTFTNANPTKQAVYSITVDASGVFKTYKDGVQQNTGTMVSPTFTMNVIGNGWAGTTYSLNGGYLAGVQANSKRALNADEIKSVADSFWQPLTPSATRLIFAAAGGSVNYTLSAASNAYAISSKTALLAFNRKLAATSQSFSISNNTATFAFNRKLSATSIAYAISAKTAVLTYTPGYVTVSYALSATSSAYAISSKTAALTYTAGNATQNYVLNASVIAYVITPGSAMLNYGLSTNYINAPIGGGYHRPFKNTYRPKQ